MACTPGRFATAGCMFGNDMVRQRTKEEVWGEVGVLLYEQLFKLDLTVRLAALMD